MAGRDAGFPDLQRMTPDQRSQVLRAYYVPHVHKPGFYELNIKDTYAIVSFAINSEASETFCVRNIPGKKHAERIVIKRLEDALTKRPTPTRITCLRVEIYLNYSPCSKEGCCEALIKFKDEQERKKVNVNMDVIFANLYNVNRPRCVEDNCEHYRSRPVDSQVDTQNKDGLKDLTEANIGLRTFTTDDWGFVAMVLFVVRRDAEDERVRQDLARILGADLSRRFAGLGF